MPASSKFTKRIQSGQPMLTIDYKGKANPMITGFKGPTEAVIKAMFGEPQQDNHVRRWRWFRYVGW